MILIRAIFILFITCCAYANEQPASTEVKPTSAALTTAPTATLSAAPTTVQGTTQDPTTLKTDPLYNMSNSKSPYLDNKLIIVGTGQVNRLYYPAGGAICRLVNRDRGNTGLKCSIKPSLGSVQNLKDLKNGEVDLALAQSDAQEHAFYGTSDFATIGRIDTMRFIMSLYDEALTVIVTEKSGIRQFNDIKGKTINIGPNGSGTRSAIIDIFKSKGWSEKDFKAWLDLAPSDEAGALCNGSVDVMILVTGHPNKIVEDVMNTCDIRILEVFDSDIQKLILASPQLSAEIIPGGIYPGIPNHINTVGMKATVVTTETEDEDTVYTITKSVFEHLKNFKSFNPAFADLDPKKMATEGRIAPYHPGALKYYKENHLVTQ